jgi:hypothetical protein
MLMHESYLRINHLVDGRHFISISGSWITLLNYDEIGETPTRVACPAVCDRHSATSPFVI